MPWTISIGSNGCSGVPVCNFVMPAVVLAQEPIIYQGVCSNFGYFGGGLFQVLVSVSSTWNHTLLVQSCMLAFINLVSSSKALNLVQTDNITLHALRRRDT